MSDSHLEKAAFWVIVACVLMASPIPHAIGAQVVYSQPAGSSGALIQSSRWDPDGSAYDARVWDAFVISSPATITEIDWRGGYDPAASGSGGPVAGFVVAIYASIPAGTQPDVTKPPLADYQIAGSAGQTLAGSFAGTTMYDYRFILPTPFQAAAGTKYWLQIEALQHGIPDWGLAPAANGDGTYFRQIHDMPYQTMAGDTAFTLLAEGGGNQWTMTFKSSKRYDGWIPETSQSSNQGGNPIASGATINVGDGAANQQYRGFLSFDTSALPANATIVSVTFKIREQRIVGSNPFATHKGLVADICAPYFGNDPTLIADDFSAAALKNAVGTFGATPDSTGWHAASLKAAAFPYINRDGTTQFRLRFRLADNGNNVADYVSFFNGRAAAANRPRLIIVYSLP